MSHTQQRFVVRVCVILKLKIPRIPINYIEINRFVRYLIYCGSFMFYNLYVQKCLQQSFHVHD